MAATTEIAINLFGTRLATWAFATLTIFVFIKIALGRSLRKQVPPNPKGWPVLGNLPEVMQAGGLLHKTMIKWAREEGDIMRIVLGPKTEYLINSDRACQIIFNTNAAHSSERPFWLVGQKYITNYSSMDLLDASHPRWKLQRKIAAQNLTSPQRIDAGLPFLYHETLKFIHQIAHDPNAGTEKQTGLFDSIGRYVYSTFCSQLFGLEVSTNDSEASHYIFESAIHEITSTISGFYLVDIFTWLDYLPLSCRPWAKHGMWRYNRDVEFVGERLEHAKKLVESGSAPDSFMTRVLIEKDKSGASHSDAAYVALKLIAAASDTSRVSTWTFIEQMMMNPGIQEKARKIIDEAVGDRLPVWEDAERIPYVRYLMKEVWRTRPPVGNGLGHRTTKDIAYGDYVIPAGSTVRPNIWAIGRDPKRHPDPDKFEPERWEGDNLSPQQSANLPDATQRDHFAFGVGRRFCPGVQVAERSFAVAIMRIIWALEIGIRPGTKLPVNPDDYAEKTLPGVPGPRLPVSLVVRKEKANLVDQAWQREMADWQIYGNMDLEDIKDILEANGQDN